MRRALRLFVYWLAMLAFLYLCAAFVAWRWDLWVLMGELSNGDRFMILWAVGALSIPYLAFVSMEVRP